jgi:hypothetical protein
MLKGKILLFSLLLVFATSAFAGDVDNCQSTCYLSTSPLRVSICPAGDFEFIREGAGGISDYIRVIVRNASGVGIGGIPWSDYWLDACDPEQALCLCCSPIAADSLTNGNGETTISGRIAGGGCVLTDGVYIAVQGKILLSAPGCIDPICLDMIIVSPDLNADCVVNLSDLGIFGLSYNKCLGAPGYNPCCDYQDDNCCNLSDFAYIGEHYQHECF